MGFSADFEVVSKRLEQTDEFIRILHGDTEFPASYFFDVRYSLKRIRPEGTWLDERELFDLKRSLQTINDIVRFFKPMDDEEIKYPALTELAGDIFVFPQLIGKIDSILDKFGKVKDSASSHPIANPQGNDDHDERYFPQPAIHPPCGTIGRGCR